MKTVIDAVNEFEGAWPYSNSLTIIYCKSGYSMYKTGDYESFVHDDFSMLQTINWQGVCNKTEFNQCCLSMATNYGTSETYADYKVNFEMINDDMKTGIDWSKAPSNCVGYSVSSAKRHYWITEDELTIGAPDYGMLEVKFTPRPEVKPVVPTYTQSMVDAGDIPLMGTECLFFKDAKLARAEWVKGVFTGKSYSPTGGAVYLFTDCVKGTSHYVEAIGRIKPLTPPKTDTEKALDDLEGVYTDYTGNIESFHKMIFKAIESGKIHGVTFTVK